MRILDARCLATRLPHGEAALLLVVCQSLDVGPAAWSTVLVVVVCLYVAAARRIVRERRKRRIIPSEFQ